MTDWLLGLMMYPLLFGSGATGLMLILFWMRRFAEVFGEGLDMSLSVPAALFAGLAFGAWGLGRFSESLRRPIFIYAFGSMIVGVSAFLVPLFMPILAQLNLVVGEAFTGRIVLLGVIRFLMTFVLTFIPMAVIGADLPVVASVLVSDPRHYGLKAGGLYVVFTLGGGCAVAFSSLVVLPRLGLHLSEMAVGGLNLLIGLASLAAAFRLRRPTVTERLPAWLALRRRGKGSDQMSWTLRVVFLSGLIGLASFVMWSRGLSLVLNQLGNTVYANNASLAFFLAGVAIGCCLISILVDHQARYLRLLGLLLTLLGMAIVTSVLMLNFGSDLFLLHGSALPGAESVTWLLALLNLSSQTLGIVGMPAMLTGMASTPAICLALDQRRMGQSAGHLLAIYILGGLVGALIGRIFLLGMLGLSLSLLALGAVQILAGLATIHKASDGRKPLVVIGSLALALLIAVSLSLSGKANRGLYAPSTPDGRQLFYEDRILETLSVLKDRLGYKTLYRQGAPSASTRPMDIACQKLLVHMPMLLRDRAERVLLLGFGNGASAYSILQHDRVREVDVAVRNLSVLKAAVYQTEANQGFLKQPDDRLKIVQGDLHDLLDQAESVFDLIAVDFTDLRQQGQARQFATPFHQTCRKLLGEEGMIAVWLPLEGLNADMVKIALATFDDVFPETTVFYITSEPTQRLLLIGQMVPWTIDFRQCERNLSESDVRDDLAEYFLDDLDKLLSFYLIGGQALDEYVADVRVNDTEWPLLEFLTPVNVNAKPLEGLDSLLENSRSVEGLISPESIPSRELDRLRMFEKARPLLIEGHRQYLQDDLEAATQSYLAALQITPGDLSLRQNLLGFPMIQQWILAAPEDPGPCILLGRVFMLQPDKSRASLELFGQAEARILKGLEAGTVSDDLGQKQLADIRIWMQELRTNIDLEDRRWP